MTTLNCFRSRQKVEKLKYRALKEYSACGQQDRKKVKKLPLKFVFRSWWNFFAQQLHRRQFNGLVYILRQESEREKQEVCLSFTRR
jgi:hypothetical protein